MARKRGRELNTRLALLQSAWQLFQLQGYESTSVDAIVATDPKGRINFANRRMQEMLLGKSGQEEKL